MFKDSTTQLVKLPSNTDSYLYLGAEYMAIVRSLMKGTMPSYVTTWVTLKTRYAINDNDKNHFNGR